MVQDGSRWSQMVLAQFLFCHSRISFRPKRVFASGHLSEIISPFNSDWWNESRRPHYSAEQIDGHKLSFLIYVKSTKNLGMCQNIYPQWQCQITDKYSAPLQCIAVLLTDGRNDNEFTFFPSRCLSVRVSSLEICTITINN